MLRRMTVALWLGISMLRRMTVALWLIPTPRRTTVVLWLGTSARRMTVALWLTVSAWQMVIMAGFLSRLAPVGPTAGKIAALAAKLLAEACKPFVARACRGL